MSGITVPTLDEITGHTVMAKLRSLCKKFIGLAQEVDDKIDAPLEEAHLAVETANATLATAQESLEDAQDAVTTANSASATANEASESAQESAETVAGYDTRLGAVELKVQTAEGNIVTIQGQITDLQTADGQNIKISNIGQYAVTLSDYQIIPGVKVFEGVPGACNARNPNIDVTEPPSSDIIVGQFVCLDRNNIEIAKIIGVIGADGQTYMNAIVRNQDGTYKAVRLITGD